MIPVAIDPSRLRVGLAARGLSGLRRLSLLRAAGAARIAIFAGDVELADAVPEACPRLPQADELAGLDVLWIAGIPRSEALPLAQAARDRRVLVTVEDVPELCDFHSVAEIRRGDLLLTVSTGGRNPGLASAVRKSLERQFGPEWAERVRSANARRQAWREAGYDMPTVGALLETFARSEGWLQ